MCVQTLKFSDQNSKQTLRNKKDKLALYVLDLYFLFLDVYFEF